MSTNETNSYTLPLISVITVTLNADKHLERCIKSVLDQDYKNIEHIVIDGGSSDGTVDILKKYDEKLAYWISEPDKGIYNAMNKALRHTKGDWIYFLGADDFLFSGFDELARTIKDPKTIYYGDCLWGNMVLGGKFSTYRLTKECICHHRILYPKRVFDKYTYNEEFRVAADYFLNIQCWNDAEFRKEHNPLLIANFSKGGFSEQVTDHLFVRKFPSIVKDHFNKLDYIRYLYKRYKNRNK